MSVLVVGLSHQAAPVAVLETRGRAAPTTCRKLLDELHRAETISEVLLLSTCNRIEVYADVARFHPARGRDQPRAGPARRPRGRRPGRAPLRPLRRGGGRAHVLGRRPGWTRWSSASRRSSASCGPRTRCGTEPGRRRLGAARPRPDRAAGRQAGAHRDRHRPGRRVDRVGRARPGASAVLGALAGRRALIVGAGSMGALAGGHAAPPRATRDLVVANRSPSAPSGWPTTSAAGPSRWTTLPAAIADGRRPGHRSPAPPGWSSRRRDRRRGPAVRSSCSTSRCPATSTRPSASLPGVTYVDLDALRADGAIGQRRRGAARPAAIVADELRRLPRRRSSSWRSRRPSPRCGRGPTR